MKSAIGKDMARGFADMARGFADMTLEEGMSTAETYSELLFEAARQSPFPSKNMRDDADTFRQLARYIRLTIT